MLIVFVSVQKPANPFGHCSKMVLKTCYSSTDLTDCGSNSIESWMSSTGTQVIIDVSGSCSAFFAF